MIILRERIYNDINAMLTIQITKLQNKFKLISNNVVKNTKSIDEDEMKMN